MNSLVSFLQDFWYSFGLPPSALLIAFFAWIAWTVTLRTERWAPGLITFISLLAVWAILALIFPVLLLN